MARPSNQLREGGTGCHARLLHEPEEQLAPMPGCSTVKPKGEFVEGIVQLFPREATLMGKPDGQQSFAR
jgi:hypothetical protein